MKIAVCGDSFSSIAEKNPGGHWSEILEKLLDVKVVNFAMRGASNLHIRLQIEMAVRAKVDFVIINATYADRIEMPTPDRINGATKRFSFFDFKTDKKYSRSPMVSVPLRTLLKNNHNLISKNQQVAVEHYFLEMYDITWKTQVDQWALNSGLWELIDNQIVFFYDPWLLDKKMDSNVESLDTMPNWLKEKYYTPLENSIFSLHHTHLLKQENDPGYHLNSEAQIIIAKYYANKIENYNLIKQKQDNNIQYDR